jgi:DNA primase
MDGRPYSNYFSTWCVFDSHKTPALLVYDDGLATCLSCRKTWTHKILDRKIGSHFIPQRNDTVSRILPKWRRWEEKYGDLPEIVDAAHKSLKAHSQFQTYLKKRKIYEFADEGKLGFLDSWITFPVYSPKHEIIDVVVRSTNRDADTRYVVHPSGADGLRPLYVPSWKKVEQSETVYVVFGIVDSIALHLSGLPVVTGVTGKSLHPDLLKPLGKRLVIIPDADEEDAAHKLANSLGWRARVRHMNYGDGCKDPDDIRRTFGNDYLLQALGA